MIVQFDATIDDLVDVTIRSSANSRTMRIWRWQGVAVTALLAGFPVYIFVSGTTVVRFTAACVAGLIAATVTLWTDQEAYRKRLHKLCREQIGTDKPFTVVVELLDSGVSVRQMGTQTSFDWPTIESVDETEDALYFYRTDASCFAVRKRGFESVAAKDEFLILAETNIQRSRGPLCSKS